jgi:hypothetical protein
MAKDLCAYSSFDKKGQENVVARLTLLMEWLININGPQGLE